MKIGALVLSVWVGLMVGNVGMFAYLGNVKTLIAAVIYQSAALVCVCLAHWLTEKAA